MRPVLSARFAIEEQLSARDDALSDLDVDWYYFQWEVFKGTDYDKVVALYSSMDECYAAASMFNPHQSLSDAVRYVTERTVRFY